MWDERGSCEIDIVSLSELLKPLSCSIILVCHMGSDNGVSSTMELGEHLPKKQQDTMHSACCLLPAADMPNWSRIGGVSWLLP